METPGEGPTFGARIVRFLVRFPFVRSGPEDGEPGPRRGFPVLAVALVALFVIGYVLVNDFGVGKARAGGAAAAPASVELPYPLSLRRAIEARVGTRTASGRPRVSGVSLSGRDPGWPVVSLVSEEALAPTVSMAREAVCAAFGDDRPETVTVNVARPTPTVFGFPRMKQVFLLSVTRGTFRKRDWTALAPLDILEGADYVDLADGWE